MVSVPVRALVAAFAAIEIVTVPFPVPLAPAVIVIHAALLVAVQAHVPADAVNVTLPLVAAAPTAALDAVSAYVQGTAAAAACVTVNVCPAIVMVPVRA